MSVHFILGPSAEGRSKIIYEHAVKAAENPEKRVLVIVPEQYTLDTQRGLIAAHPRHALLNIDVVSFNRLAYKVLGKAGGGNTPIIRDSGKAMIIRKILKRCERSLKFFAPKMRKRGLVSEMKSIISEFDQYGINNETLNELTENIKSGKNDRLSLKLSDIALVSDEFHREIESRFVTQEELLDVLKRKLDETGFLNNSSLFFDGFTGFTTTQYRLLETLIRQAERVEIAVSYDRETTRSGESDPGSGNLFFMSDDFMNRVTDAAAHVNVKVGDSVFCKGPVESKAPGDLEFLKHHIFRKDAAGSVYDGASEGIILTEAADAREEISVVINKIYELTRNEGYRYRDIAVVTEDTEKYGDMAYKLMRHNDFPVFLDQRRSVSENPYIENIRSLLQIVLKGWTYENVFRFLKTGFSGMDKNTTDLLDNYCLAAGINTKTKWKKKWENPTRKQRKDAEGNRVPFYDLDVLNEHRKTVVSLIETFEKNIKKTEDVKGMTDVVRNHLASEFFGFEEGSITDRISKKVDEILDETEELFGDEKADTEEFAEILDAAFEELSLGFIPPTVDCITIGDIERTRLTNIKALFVVGVNEGVIPKGNEDAGILTQAERLKIAENNIMLSPTNKEKAFIQRFYLYLLFTKPFEKLFISYSKKDYDGTALAPSSLIKSIRDMFPGLKPLGVDEGTRKSFQIWLPESRTVWTPDHFPVNLSTGTAELLYGKRLKGSVSSLEKYAGCPFSYLLSSGLKLSSREIYDFNTADFGTVIHVVLKNILTVCVSNKKSITDIEEGELIRLVNEETEKTCEDFFILKENGRKGFIRQRINELSLVSARTIGEQLKRGAFRPDLLEHPFAIKRKLTGDRELIFNGVIDRVDIAESGSGVHVRVVDYKTGNRDFDLEGVYYGRQIQLINYLGAAVEVEKKRYKGKTVIPSGMLYYNINDPLIDQEDVILDDDQIEEKRLEELRMPGVVRADNETVELTDIDATGEVVKCIRYDKGELKSSDNLYESEKLELLGEYGSKMMNRMAEEILDGSADVNPLIDLKDVKNEIGEKKSACAYCEYGSVCNFSGDLSDVRFRKYKHMKKEEIWEQISRSKED